MAAGTGRDGNKYEWQSWPPDSLEGIPPKRRRLVAWGLLWFLLVGWLVGVILEVAGVVQPWRSLLTVTGAAALFAPLIRGAALETRQLRAEGITLPSYPVTRKTLISNAVITGILWALFAVLVIIGQPVFPLLAVASTIWLLYLLLRWRAGQKEPRTGA
ncbi:hypothetical protein B1A87_003040 [Arthrobacter sp. KBS0703]|uniref:hypothetical protein n=1 Tax=Arthrobacter sp. KBS0703 TaxID=1955698 RepID=UPI00098F4840|nr:hypothetical protein [Arthrobacter sp. KBS0703]TSE15042.1 hypothetical protein B1A87_003040 [Arthrobacter sp. KBS0703]